jgi:hypothetical protein
MEKQIETNEQCSKEQYSFSGDFDGFWAKSEA